MQKNFVEELRWRGMLHDITPETEDYLLKTPSAGYIGFDPTSDSLHIGSLVPIFILKHFQNAGHTPVVLLGGATGMIGDPSGKSDERNLLDKNILKFNEKKLKLALVGCGGRGTGAAVQALNADENVELVAMADAFGDRLEKSLKSIQKNFDGEKKINVKEKNRFTGFGEDIFRDDISSSIIRKVEE